MNDSEKDAVIHKELQVVDIYIKNICMTSSWRLPTNANLARDARSSLRKISALTGYSGQWWRDVLLYIATMLPLLIPVNIAIAVTVFKSLEALINNSLSYVTMKPKNIAYTSEEVCFLYFLCAPQKTINQTIMVPEVHYPHWSISRGFVVLMVFMSIFAASWLLKRIWIHEIKFRRHKLEMHWNSILKHNEKDA